MSWPIPPWNCMTPTAPSWSRTTTGWDDPCLGGPIDGQWTWAWGIRKESGLFISPAAGSVHGRARRQERRHRHRPRRDLQPEVAARAARLPICVEVAWSMETRCSRGRSVAASGFSDAGRRPCFSARGGAVRAFRGRPQRGASCHGALGNRRCLALIAVPPPVCLVKNRL